ncbi:MAG: ferrous iron transport protein B, partial [Bacteroidales bacterium]|nr:ferrous iron transport protein B [Bacteroidales bacterium]
MTGEKKINIVLAGQGNAGKSTVFNYLTGLHQHIGNWAGKTIEKREGTLFYKDYTIDVVDLPGIYSLATLSDEELIAREYITRYKPDYVVNIVDSSNLERNLVFTLQLLELECPVIIVLNMIDLAKKKGIAIDYKKLQDILGIPVLPAIASRGSGLTEIIDKIIELKEKKHVPKTLKYGREIEDAISTLMAHLRDHDLPYPPRWMAIKLLEKDNEIIKLAGEIDPVIPDLLKKLWQKLEGIHGHDASIVIADERCHLVSHITRATVRMSHSKELSLNERLDILTTHKVTGYLLMFLMLGGMFLTIFSIGNWISSGLESVFQNWHKWWVSNAGTTFAASLGWSAIEGVLALIQIAIPYILPFYIILYVLEDWGYIARISFLMDNFMHRMGIHGKACIPLIIGLGCNVPGCLSCRIMESRRERFITAVLVSLVPCSAVSVIIFGLVGKYVGLLWALGLYLMATAIVFLAGRLSSKFLLGEPVELIMPMPDYKTPHLKTIATQ